MDGWLEGDRVGITDAGAEGVCVALAVGGTVASSDGANEGAVVIVGDWVTEVGFAETVGANEG